MGVDCCSEETHVNQRRRANVTIQDINRDFYQEMLNKHGYD